MLDFGGNIGNMLRDRESTIDEERYTCIDVDPESIAKGRKAFPRARWIHYDRRCFYFNPDGVPRLPLPDLGSKFDVVVAYSVFTNTDRTDLLQLVGQLRAILEPGGALAFTYIDPAFRSWPHSDHRNNFEWRLAREGNDLGTEKSRQKVAHALAADWCMLVNGSDLHCETDQLPEYDEQRSCHVFYDSHYLQSLFPDAVLRRPVNGEMQHCAVIRKA